MPQNRELPHPWGIAVFVAMVAFAITLAVWLLFLVEGGWKLLVFCLLLNAFFSLARRCWKLFTNLRGGESNEANSP